MGVVINVFYTGKKAEELFIAFLVNKNFVHYVDSVRHNDPNWITSNCKKGLYRCEYGGEHDYESPLPVHLENATSITYTQDEFYVLIVDCLEEDVDFYEKAKLFLTACLENDEIEACYYKTHLLDMQEPRKEESVKRSIDETYSGDFVSISSEYSFDSKNLKDLDCMFYQLTKPNTDRPYVVLVKNFSKHGHKRLFSSMRIFDSWGMSRHDIGFLHELWEHLGMEGEPDFDAILQDHVEACLYGEDEPKVWRNNIDSVITDYIRNVNKR